MYTLYIVHEMKKQMTNDLRDMSLYFDTRMHLDRSLNI